MKTNRGCREGKRWNTKIEACFETALTEIKGRKTGMLRLALGVSVLH